jgi:hypothetical protein
MWALIPWGLLARVFGVIALAFAAWFGWHEFTGHYIDIGVKREAVHTASVQKAFDDYRAEAEAKTRAAQAEIASGIADLEAEKAQLKKERDDRTKKYAELLKSLPVSVANDPVPAVAVGVLNDAIRAANAESAPAPGGTGKEAATATGDSTVGEIALWGVQVTKQYSECVDQVDGLQRLWNQAREAFSKEVPP